MDVLLLLLEKIRPWGFSAALISCMLNGVWLVCLFHLLSISSSDTIEQAFQAPRLFRASVGASLLLTIAAVPVALTVGLTAAAYDQGFPGRALVGSCIYLCYVPINLIAYYLYGMVFPRMVVASNSLDDHGESLVLESLMVSLDIGRPYYALFGSLPFLGYGLLGLGWCILGSALLGRSNLWRWVSSFFILSGTLSVMGAVGNFVDAGLLTHGTMVGGIFSLPAFALLSMALDSVKNDIPI